MSSTEAEAAGFSLQSGKHRKLISKSIHHLILFASTTIVIGNPNILISPAAIPNKILKTVLNKKHCLPFHKKIEILKADLIFQRFCGVLSAINKGYCYFFHQFLSFFKGFLIILIQL